MLITIFIFSEGNFVSPGLLHESWTHFDVFSEIAFLMTELIEF